MDSRRAPSLLAENQVAFAVNVTVRGGYCDQRPPFAQHPLTFADTESRDWFQDRTVQAWCQYRDQIAIMVGGRLFMISPLDQYRVADITPRVRVAVTAQFITPPMDATVEAAVSDPDYFQVGIPAFIKGGLYVTTSKAGSVITLTNRGASAGLLVSVGEVIEALDPNLVNLRHNWMVQAEQYLIVQDGFSKAIIYDGTSRRSDPQGRKEVPTGTAMAYGNNRLWVAVNGRQFVAGDINHGPTRVINFTENEYLAGGGAFTVPGDAGKITGMLFMPTLDTALGQGPLQIFTENSIYSVNLPTTREAWQTLNSPVQTMSFRGFGAVNDKSIAIVNGDVFYRSRDGIRSYVLAVREFGTWGNVPVSAEMSRIVSDDPPSVLDTCSSCVFDNRLLVTTALQPDAYGAYGNALAVLDFEPLSGMGQKASPAWDGFWTGLDFRLLLSGSFKGVERCFAIARNADGESELWEIEKTGALDNGQCKIRSFIETRSHLFNSLFELKRLEGLELWVDNVQGDVDWDVKYRQDRSPCWKNWQEWTFCQSAKDCPTGPRTCWVPEMKLPGYRTRLGLKKPVSQNDESDGKPSDLGYEFQVRIEWNGRARLLRYLLRGRETEESVGGNFVD